MKKLFFFLIIFLLIMPLSSQAKTNLNNRNDVFDFLHGAFEAQVSLSNQFRTKEEITDILNPYFSHQFQQAFWNENIVKEGGKYITYGSDFAQYYIPFYHFSNKTKVVIGSDEIYVFEYFPASTEGPVGYKSHYEGLLLKKISDDWKVDKFLYNNIPKNIIEKAKNKTKRSRVFSILHYRQLFY
ncbi:DUF3993 domain-containing protein [Neobacillus ginsengisoli]|uniref:DUF3993 domain-containing protein n=1 Tax=Neobacillus ginsengisoli TaxID=904295 RepID=A0ABT9XS83_9BACI|nr:DUF3993 domain-containing protein [Neobacillus ginsengisoli]MDQ0198415.1 hypothetical protein [Neobacillus ginsengisoli]